MRIGDVDHGFRRVGRSNNPAFASKYASIEPCVLRWSCVRLVNPAVAMLVRRSRPCSRPSDVASTKTTSTCSSRILRSRRWRSIASGVLRAALLLNAHEAPGHRPDDSRAHSRGGGDRLQQVGHGRLAVGPRDRGHRHLVGRVFEERGRQGAQRVSHNGDDRLRRVRRPNVAGRAAPRRPARSRQRRSRVRRPSNRGYSRRDPPERRFESRTRDLRLGDLR